MNRIEELEAEIELLKEQADLSKSWPGLVRQLSDISDVEKIGAFDAIYRSAYREVEFLAEHGYEQKDNDHYMWETVMTTTLGKDIFKVWNKLY